MDVIVSNYAWIKKDNLTEDQLKFLRSNLTIYPKEFRPDEEKGPKKIELFKETEISFGMPRAYFESKKKSHHKIEYRVNDGNTNIFKKIPINFKGTLREVQQPVYEEVLEKISEGSLGGIIKLGTGIGKSVLALALMAALKRPMLVVVDREFLLNQWVDYAKEFLPEAKVGVAQQDRCDFKDKHLVVAMVHSLVARDYGKDFYNYFGITCFDEVQIMGSEYFSQAAPKFAPRVCFGLSATPNRKDGADAVIQYHIGSIISTAEGTMLTPKIRRVWTNFHLVQTAKFNPALLSEPTILRFLCANASRNEQIVGQIIEALKADRKILVLSSRVKHLNVLQMMLNNIWKKENPTVPLPSSGLYIGGMEESEREKSNKCRVIFATYQCITKGYNNKPLDTLVLATPMSDVTQQIGRILRENPNKKQPIVVDIRDDLVSIFKSKAKSRDEIYEDLTKKAAGAV